MEPLHSPAVIQRLLREYGLRPSKALGQNFLADQNIVRRVVQAAAVHRGDLVLEIGPGLGSLTQGLLEAGARVVAVEKDARLVEALGELFRDQPQVTVVHADALKTDLGELLRAHGAGGTQGAAAPVCKVAANLPYSITSPLLVHILESDLPVERIVVMVQREVAERLVAPPGTKEYGALTVAVQYRARVELAGRVPPAVFVPAPTVWSEIVVLFPREERLAVGRSFAGLVKAAFGQRRKTLRNALKAMGLAAGTIEEVLAEAGLDGQRRGETLSVEEFAVLSRAVDAAGM